MDASTAVSSRLIGAIFVEKGLVTPDQLERAMQIQAETGDRLGEVIVAEFGVARLELASVLAEQWAEFERTEQSPDSAPPSPEAFQPEEVSAEPQLRRPIGEIFVDRGFISEEQLLKAVEVQSKTGQRIGEVLVEQGSLSRLDLASALAEQWSALQKLRPPEPVANEPWQGGAPVASPTTQASTELSASLAELETRVRIVERAAAASPWEEDLGRVSTELRAAVAELEHRLAQARGEQTSTEGLEAAVAELRERVEAPSVRLEELERRVGDAVTADVLDTRLAVLEQLSNRLDELSRRASVPDGLEELRSRVEDLVTGSTLNAGLDALRADIAQLVQRVEASEAIDTPADIGDKLDAVAGRAEAAQTDLAALASRLDDLSGLQERVDSIAERLPGEEVVNDMRRTLSELAARPSALPSDDDQEAALGALAERLDRLAAQVEEISSAAAHSGDDELRAAVDGLRSRIDELHDRSVDDSTTLQQRLDAHDEKALEQIGAHVAEIGRRLEEQRLQFDARLGDIAAAVPDVSELDTMHHRLEELAGAITASGAATDLDERIAALENRLVDLGPVNELREEVERVAASAAGERASLEQALLARVDEITTGVPAVDEFAELRDRVSELAARTAVDEGVRAHVAELAARLDAAASVGESVESLRQTFAALDLARAEDARATNDRLTGVEHALAAFDDLAAKLGVAASAAETVESLRQTVFELDAARAQDAHEAGERLLGVEQAIAAVDGLEERMRSVVTESDGALAHRIEEAQRRLDDLGSLEGHLAELREDVGSRIHAASFAETESALRAELEALVQRLDRQEQEHAARPAVPDQTARIDGIGVRLDQHARDVHGRLAGLAADVNARIEGLELGTEAFVGREELSATIAERAASLAAELGALRADVREREQTFAEKLESLADRSAVDDVNERITAQQSELSARHDEIVAQLNDLRELSAGRDEWQAAVEARLDRRIDERLDEASQRFAATSAQTQAELEQAAGALRAEVAGSTDSLRTELEQAAGALRAELAGSTDSLRAELDTARQETRLELEAGRGAAHAELGSLALRLDELHGLQRSDTAAARDAVATLGVRVDELHSLRSSDAEAAQGAAVEAAARLDQLAVSLRRDATAARETADRVAARVEELEGSRADEAESTQIAAAELVARLDDLALRTAGAAAEAERALRDELSGIAARMEEQDAAGIEAREELRVELDRVASSVGWRLERIEESLSSDDHEALRAAVAEVERRLDAQLSQQDEQVRVTERALRKGLASLGERLADSETAYLEAGSALRRSIQRLGAAVVEADARMAEQIPVSEAEGYVAFAPTAEGYRLVQVPGRPPELGAAVEVEGCDGPLVVTRYGRSPLPLDNRPCAYLDRS